MTQELSIFGYRPNRSWVARLTGSCKMLTVLLITTVSMISFDTRLLVSLSIVGIALLPISQVRFRDYRVVLALMLVLLVLNIITIYLFAPLYGTDLYSSETVLLGHGPYRLTAEQLFYELNVLLKYFCTFPFTLVFFLTTNPSEFSAELNRIGVPYRIAYAVEIALRYIPDIQSEYHAISLATQARGYDMSTKVSLLQRVRGAVRIIMPLVFSSLDRVDTVSQAMELRRFGQYRTRTWYHSRAWQWADWLVLVVVLMTCITAIVLMMVDAGRFYNPFE